MGARVRTVVVAFVVLAACGDDGDMMRDGGPGPDALGADFVTPPNIPWLAAGETPPRLSPCPAGWRESTISGAVVCEPHPATGPDSCARGEAHFLGASRCEPLGDACPDGDYATDLPATGTVVYVRAGAAAGGNGTEAQPYATLGAVPFAALPPGATVALSKGMHSSIISAPAGVHIVGACARDTIVTTTTSTTVGVLSIVRPGPPVEFRNLTVADAPNIGIFVGGGASVSLRGVLVEGASPMGLLAMGVGTSVTIEEVAVRDAFALPSAGSDALGVGIVGGASLDATRLVVDSNDQLGIVIGDAGTSATLDDTIVRATAAITDEFGLGILVQTGARLNASRLLIEENHWAGLHISGIGTIATIEDAVIRSTQLSAAGTAGLGLAVQQGAQLMGSRLWLDRNHDVGLLVASDGTSASLEDVVVTQTQPQESDGDYGYGVTVAIGGHLEMRRAVIADNHYIGIVATSTGTQTVLEDVLVQDTAIGPDLEWPTRGVFSTNGARLDLSRTVLRRNVGIGLHIDGEATAATVADLVVSDMNPDADGSFGVGIQVQLGAQLDGDRISVDRVFQEALAAIGSASVTVSDVSLSNVEVASCAATTCPDNAFGYGAASAAASLRMTRFAIGPVANCGVFLSGFEGFVDPAEVDLDTGVVGQSAIGACVQVDEYDLDRLTDGVAYTDNGTNLDTTTLPVPESSDAIAVIEP